MPTPRRWFHSFLIATLFLPTLGWAQSPSPAAPLQPTATAPLVPETMDLPSAIAALNSDNDQIRERAIEQLLASSVREHGWVPRLVVLLKDTSAAVRAPAAQLLGEINAKEAIPNLLPLTKDPVARVRQATVKALTLLEAREAVPYFIDLLTDENEDVALEAATGLQHFGDDRAVKALTDMMINGQSYRLRKAAIRALGDMHSSQPVSQLIVLLEYERDIWLRLDIAQALAKIGDDEAMKPILRFLEEVRKEENAQIDKRRKKVYSDIAEELEKLVQQMRRPAAHTQKKAPVAATAPDIQPPVAAPAPAAPPGLPAEAAPLTPAPSTTPEEVVKPLPKKAPPRSSKKKAAPAAKTASGFTIQVKATNNADLAHALVEDLKLKGVDAQLTEFQKDRETWYRVRIGSFATRQAAEAQAKELGDKKLIEEFFITK